MDSRNMIVLVGRLVADPDLRYTNDGTPVANFAVAVNRSTPKPDGTWEDSVDGFFDCEHFGKTAVTLSEGYGKGSEVQVAGSLHQRKFQVGNGAGQRTASKIVVRAKTVAPVLPAAKNGAGTAATQSQTQAATPAPVQQQVVPQPA